MSLSLLLQQCPACLVRLTWLVFEMGSKWLYSCCFVRCSFLGLSFSPIPSFFFLLHFFFLPSFFYLLLPSIFFQLLFYLLPSFFFLPAIFLLSYTYFHLFYRGSSSEKTSVIECSKTPLSENLIKSDPCVVFKLMILIFFIFFFSLLRIFQIYPCY